MKIKSVYVENFRSIRAETLSCDALTALVGANGAGKSSFLQALEVFYDINARVDAEDYCDRNVDLPITIRVTYGDLRTDEQEEFKSYIDKGLLAVTKRITCNEGKIEQSYYASSRQLPAFADIRELQSKKREQINAWNELVKSRQLPGLTQTVRTATEIDPLMQAYESTHSELLEPRERQDQFFGPRNIGAGKLDKFTKFVRLPAVREVSSEASGRGATLTQLLETLVTRKLLAREDVQSFRRDFGERLKALYAPDKTAELTELATNISRTLRDYVPGAEFGLNFGEVSLPEMPAPVAIPRLTEDGFEGDITRKGHGLQRALIFALLQHLAVLQRDTSMPAAERGAGEGASSPSGPDLILALEEPELYQHPQRCRYLADLLLELSSTSGRGLGSGNQVIYTTHSAYFVTLDRFEQVRLVRKKPAAAGAPVTTVASFSMVDAAKRAADISDAGMAAGFTASGFKARAYPIMTTAVSEGFFANTIAVVEGMTEAGALWRMSDLLKLQWKQLNIVVIPAEGKSKLDRPVIIFRGFGIPTYFIFDGDSRHKGGGHEQQTLNQNKLLLRLAGVPPVDFPPQTIADSWACFENDFESYCRSTVGDAKFDEHRKVIGVQYSYERESDVLKNFDAAGDFVERLYSDGLKLPALEEIARNIGKLAV
jgi:putative ATP-dependent endonuclease of OLD family